MEAPLPLEAPSPHPEPEKQARLMQKVAESLVSDASSSMRCTLGEMSQATCTSCDAIAPIVKTTGTLAQHGWRMETVEFQEGTGRIDWFCPTC